MNRRNQVLFLIALLGLLAVLGTLVYEIFGSTAAGVYVGATTALILVLAGRARGAEVARRRAAGRTCTCCTSTHFDPVKVI